MQKIKRVLILVTILFISVTISGCVLFGDETTPPTVHTITFETNGGSAVSPSEVVDGEKLVKPDDPSKDDYVFAGWFSDESLTTLYDFETVVSSSFTLYADWTVEEMTLVLDTQLSSNLVEFNSNKEEKENKKTEYFDRTKDYIVGDDNAFSVKPEVSFIAYNTITNETRPIAVSSWEYEIEVRDINDKVIDLENTDLIDNVDNVNCTVDFASQAIGQSFTIAVVPKGLTEKQLLEINKYTITFSVKVSDGYNVYNAKELAYLDNRQANTWKDFKQANGLDVDLVVNNLILHKSIEITANDLPQAFFWQESELNKSDADYEKALGSMKDYENLFERTLKAGEKVTISGNYFTLSVRNLREVVRANDELANPNGAMSHSQLFYFIGDGESQVLMEDLNIIGNAPRVEDVLKAGGIIMNKVQGPAFTIRNTITACCFISFFPEQTRSAYLVEQCKAYDSFNSFVYSWGADNVTIKDSEMIGAGGPVIIQDHINSTSSGEDNISSHVTVINSKLESYVTGTEGWFNIVGASMLVPQIKALDKIFNPVGRSFLKASSDGKLTYMNLICVNKSGSAESITAEKIDGYLSLDDKVFDYGKSANPALNAVLEQTFTMGAPTFQSSEADIYSGYGFTDGTSLLTVDMATSQFVPINDPTNKLFTGDYLGMYYSGMFFVLEYGASGQIYQA